MGWKKSAIASQTHQRRTLPLPGPACGTAMRRKGPEAVAGMCAVGRLGRLAAVSGIAAGRLRRRIRRFQGKTAGWLPEGGFAVTLWLLRLRAAHPTHHARSQHGCA